MSLDKLLHDPVTATQQTLEKIFSDDYVFTVPPYQRPYEWAADDASILLDDVSKACAAAHGKDRQETYFLGSIVLIKKPEIPACEIIDGQQRLTTLTILLAVLRDLSSEKDAIKRHVFLCQEGDKDKGTTDRYRLAVREHDKAFFEHAIQRRGSTHQLETHGTVEENRSFFLRNATVLRDRLRAMDEAGRDRLMAFLIQRCFLVVIAVVSEESAHRIFKVLNTRGVDLSATDLLKADLLEALPADERRSASRRWEAFETKLGREAFNALFEHMRMIRERAKAKDKLAIGFLRAVPELKTEPRTFLGVTLESYVDLHHTIMSSTAFVARYKMQAERLLSQLRRLDNVDWVPCLLLYLQKHKDGGDLVGFLATLERCAYFMFICGFNINERINRYAKGLAQIDNMISHSSPSFALGLQDKEKQMLLQRLDEPLYDRPKLCKPLLLRIDSMLSNGLASYDHASTTVEHIVPQNAKAGSKWAAVFADDAERERWIGVLGNLALLSRSANSKAGNAPFEQKQIAYTGLAEGANTFMIDVSLMHEPIFDLATLKRRHERLKDRIAAVWKLRSPG